MEIVIILFIGIWLSGAAVLAYIQLNKDFTDNKKRECK